MKERTQRGGETERGRQGEGGGGIVQQKGKWMDR